MLKISIQLSLGLLVLCLITSGEGFRRRGHGKYRKEQPNSTIGAGPALPNQDPARRGLGLSAWGIVTVIVSLILAIAGMYYFSICYPIICQKNKKYDMIGLTSVA